MPLTPKREGSRAGKVTLNPCGIASDQAHVRIFAGKPEPIQIEVITHYGDRHSIFRVSTDDNASNQGPGFLANVRYVIKALAAVSVRASMACCMATVSSALHSQFASSSVPPPARMNSM